MVCLRLSSQSSALVTGNPRKIQGLNTVLIGYFDKTTFPIYHINLTSGNDKFHLNRKPVYYEADLFLSDKIWQVKEAVVSRCQTVYLLVTDLQS